jgi:hypothetical protein
MTNWVIYEGDGETIGSKMASPQVVIGDTIEYVTNNQLGYKKVRVVQGEDGNKHTITLVDFGMGIFEEPEDDFGDKTDDEQDGGKRRKRRKRSRKTRKSHKSRKGRKHRKTRRTRRH